MRLIMAILPLASAAVLLVGCSKSEKLSDVKGDVTSVPASPVVDASLQDVDKKLQAKQYDAAVGTLVSLQGVPKSDAQQAAFMNQVRQANDELAKQAAQGDQGALASQQMLGRFLNGR